MTCGEKRKNLILPGFSRNAFVYLHFDATEAFVAKTVVVTQGVKGGVRENWEDQSQKITRLLNFSSPLLSHSHTRYLSNDIPKSSKPIFFYPFFLL